MFKKTGKDRLRTAYKYKEEGEEFGKSPKNEELRRTTKMFKVTMTASDDCTMKYLFIFAFNNITKTEAVRHVKTEYQETYMYLLEPEKVSGYNVRIGYLSMSFNKELSLYICLSSWCCLLVRKTGSKKHNNGLHNSNTS